MENRANHLSLKEVEMETLKVSGMSCQHCVASVTKALEELTGIEDVTVSLEAGEVSYTSNGTERQTVKDAISSIGFDPGE